MGKIRDILSLIRVRQWYKNVVIFMGIFFGGKIFDFKGLIAVSIGFLLISLTSSINYIINDIMDIEKDKVHKEKMKRPLASGRISKVSAILLTIIIGIIVIGGSWYVLRLFVGTNVTLNFLVMVGAIFFSGLLYNIYAKHVGFIDIILLSMIYIWRTMAGCFIVVVEFSPWLYLLVFEIALFLAVNKRKADLDLLGEEDAIKHKPVYKNYDKYIIDLILEITIMSLFITYSLYCVLGPIANYSGPQLSHNRGFIIFSIPIALYVILRYVYIARKNPEIARSAQKAIKDVPLIVGGALLVLMIYIANYIDLIWIF
ncbi:MAG: UbiA prenyltransferase family protein [Promethearchaeota archaeon]